jgi:DNA-binding IclR family transcriptional regulator
MEEHTPGISAAGIALLDTLGNPIAISVPVPTQRFDEAKELIAERLLETKHALQDLVESR